MAVSSPCRSVSLPLLVGYGGAAVRFLLLQDHPGESFRSVASCEVGVCREGAPPRLASPSGVGEAMATAALWNNVSRLLPRPGGVLLRRQRRGRGAMYRSPGSALHRLGQVMLVLAFFFDKGAEQAVGVANGGRLDPSLSSLGDACRRRRALIQGLQELGRSPGRRANADGFFYCDSKKSLWAKGLLQFVGTHVFFSGGDDRRR